MKNRFAPITKKAGAILIALVLIFVFASCKQEENAQIPNPIVEVKGSGDFQPLGVVLTAPQGAEDTHYSIIAKTTAQIQFTLDGRAYTYRAAKTADDISGVYSTLDAAESYDLTLGGETIAISVATISGGDGGALAKWSYGDASYTLYTPDKADADTVGALAQSLAGYDLPVPAFASEG